MDKGKRSKTDRKQEEPSIEDRQELALLYIQRMRKKKIEPPIENIAKKYLISEEMVRELFLQETLQEQPGYDVFLPSQSFIRDI